MTHLDIDECEVWCRRCNGFLYCSDGWETKLVDCPYECKTEYDPSTGKSRTTMKVPPGEQKYGRS